MKIYTVIGVFPRDSSRETEVISFMDYDTAKKCVVKTLDALEVGWYQVNGEEEYCTEDGELYFTITESQLLEQLPLGLT